MKRLIEYFIKYPVSGNILILLILFLGWIGFSSLRSTLIPQIDPGIIVIQTQYPGASPEEIEQGIILKIEDNLKGLTGIKKVTSTSMENVGTITVEITSGVNSDLVLQDVKNAVDGISSFPSGIEPPRISKIEFRSTAIEFMISGDADLRRLKAEAQKVETDLLKFQDISKIELTGFPDEEIEVAIRETDLETYNLTISDVLRVVKGANIDLTGGTIRGATEDLNIRIRQKKYYANELEDIILRTSPSGSVIRLSDVADVHDKWAEEPNLVFVNGKPAVLLTVKYTNQEDIIKIADIVEDYILKFNETHNNLKATVINNEASSVRSMQEILANNGAMGFLLVIFFLSIALNPRMSFWVAISIPLSFLGMFALAAVFDITLNRISLFGMILVVGILVDDGIVIAENIYQHFEAGKKPVRAAIDGALEVLPAVFSAVLTTIVAFSSFLLIEGMFGQFFKEMAFVVMAALFISLIEGALILPSHIAHSKALRTNHAEPTRFRAWATSFVEGLRIKYYEPLLNLALKNKIITLIFVTSLFMITFGAAKGGIIQMGGSSFENKNNALLTLEMPPGTPEHITMETLDILEASALRTAEIFSAKEEKNVYTTIVKQLTATNTGSISINLIDSRERDFISTEFSNAWRNETGILPQAERINFVEESHFGKAVSVSLLCKNIGELNAAVTQLKSELEQISTLKNVIDNNQQGMREIEITLKDKAYLLGLNPQQVMDQVRGGFFGAEVQRLNRGLDEVKIWVRYAGADRSSIGDLENMRIRTAKGEAFLLKDIANLNFGHSVSMIRHLNGQREIGVMADALDGSVDLSKIKKELVGVILPKIKKQHPGVSFYFGGRQERMKESVDSMASIMPAILVLLFAIIAFTFRSFLQTLLIFGLVPLGFIGIGWGHAIHSVPVDMPSYFGIIALLGIIVNDSIVFINTLNLYLSNGLKFQEALRKAGSTRFRPILLTSLTTMAGLAPIIIANNPDAQQTVPMAIAVAYGLLIATTVTLIVLPVMLNILNTFRRHLVRIRTGEMPSAEAVETAVTEKAVESLM